MIATQAIAILNDQIGLNFINGHDAMNQGLNDVKKFIEANFKIEDAPETRHITPGDILRICASEFNLPVEEVRRKGRGQKNGRMICKQLAQKLTYEFCKVNGHQIPLKAIGHYYGCDHSTIINSIQKIDDLLLLYHEKDLKAKHISIRDKIIRYMNKFSKDNPIMKLEAQGI